MLNLSKLNKILAVHGALLGLSFSLVSATAQGSAYLEPDPSVHSGLIGSAMVKSELSGHSKHKVLNHPAVALNALGLLGASDRALEGLTGAVLAGRDFKVLAASASTHSATPAFALSLISLVKSGGVTVHF